VPTTPNPPPVQLPPLPLPDLPPLPSTGNSDTSGNDRGGGLLDYLLGK
jgi:hypothetical protein